VSRARRRDPAVSYWPLVDETADEHQTWMQWLVRLRWVAIVSQFVTLSFSVSLLYSPWLVVPLAAVIGVLALGNLQAIQRLGRGDEVTPNALVAQLSLDIVALSGFFLLAGGRDNPFTILYVIHVAMAAVMLSARRAAAMTAFVLFCYALIHIWHLPLRFDAHMVPAPTVRLFGAVVSFTITAVSLAGFVVGLATTLRRRGRQLLEARDRTARTDRLRSVGTLAAGAAHELNTPLSTIGLRVRRIARRHEDADTVRDLDVMRQQLQRCKSIVEQLLIGAGDPSAGGFARLPLGGLVREGVDMWSKGSVLSVNLLDESGGVEVDLPRVAFIQALINLLENAREAQVEAGSELPIVVRVTREAKFGVVLVQDHGVGLPGEADRVGEPFYTTKTTGTGLGVFVARSVADGAGGGLSYARGPGDVGTEARWWFPEARRIERVTDAGVSPVVAGPNSEYSPDPVTRSVGARDERNAVEAEAVDRR
jgi:two-component system sensor histidine kinase RegB